jgi:Xaa-Pro aminopeptidase
MLTQTGCLQRQQRLREKLNEARLDAAVMTDRHEIYYFTGLLLQPQPFTLPVVLWLEVQGGSWLIAPASSGKNAFVDEHLLYPQNEGATMNPDNLRRLCGLLKNRLMNVKASRIGYQAESMPYQVMAELERALSPTEKTALDDTLERMQRRKDPDEIDLIRRSVQINIAAYDAAHMAIAPGVREIDVMAAGRAASLRAAGEWVYHNGDYQSGVGGGFARDRAIEAGELYIIDAWTNYRGYWSDMSRVFSVGNNPTPVQVSLFEHLKKIQLEAPKLLKPGVDGRDVWRELDRMVREHPALAEKGLVHHGGHGIGLRAHEQPDLNPERGGLLEVGTVVTIEPGAYFAEANGGARIENMYLITESGPENLSVYPIEL